MRLNPVFPTFIGHFPFKSHKKYIHLFDDCTSMIDHSPDNWSSNLYTTFHEDEEIFDIAELRYDLSNKVIGELNIPSTYVKDLWYNVYHNGSYQERHHHCEPGIIMSGIYFYRNASSPVFWNRDASIISSMGYNKYLCDSPFANIRMGDNLTIEVSDGDIIIFPPDLEHEVPRYEGNSPRITFSFNISLI